MITLANHGLAQTEILIPAAASETNRFAAQELARYLKAIGGAAFSIHQDDYPFYSCADRLEVCVGPVNREGVPDTSGLKNDGYILRTEHNRLFIAGENDRGILYGVYGFLEEVLGCRFYAQGVEKVPTRSLLQVPELDEAHVSPFEYRETSWNATLPTDIAYKRGLNGYRHGLCKKRGGGISYDGFVHTFSRDYISPEEYFDEHPEYFSMVDGKRIRDHAQLCLTNPEVLEIVIRKLREKLAANPDATIFSISQNDWYNPCQCPECARVDEEEGSHAGTLLRFVNACANAIAEDYPHAIIDTLAYQYTRQAPKITKPAPNVCIRICSIECCFSHPLAECNETAHFKDRTRQGATFQDDMRDWAKICRRMHVWDYTTNYRHYLNPMPNFHVLQPNIKFFLENGVTGLFEQGNGESPSGEFGELRAYLITKLMWNPDLDVSEAMNDFLTGYYGRAAAPIRAYIDMLREHVVKQNIHVGIYCSPQQGHIPEPLLEKAEKLFDRAEALADDEDVLARVQRSRLQIRYVRLNITPAEDPAYGPMAEALIRDLARFGLTRVREWEPMEKSVEKLRANTVNDNPMK